MTTTTIRVGEPRELLAYLPFRLGFRPRRSAVVVSLRGGRGRIGLVARVDLADLADPGTGPDVANGLATHLWRDGAEQAVLVLYDDDAHDDGAWHEDVAAAARHALDPLMTMIGQAQVWVVDDARYYSFDCQDAQCCPPAGRPLGELDSTQVSAQMVFAGASIAEHRGAATQIVRAPKSARYNVRRVARRWTDRRTEQLGESGPCPDGFGAAELRSWYQESMSAWCEALAAVRRGEPPRARDLGRIDAALHDTYLRDLVITSVAVGEDRVTRALELPEARARQEIAVAFGELFEPEGELEPDRERLAPAERVLRAVLAHSGHGLHAPAATVLAALAWWSGDGATANDWLDRAFAAAPEYHLARLLAATVEAGLPPGWARRAAARDSALR